MPLVRAGKTSLLLLSVMLISTTFLLAGKEQSQPSASTHNPFNGADIFRQYCASCHGADARGRGPAAVALKHAVPDLTRIAQRHQDKFPAEQVKKIIAGSEEGPIAHGNREMPIWGPIFHEIESDRDLGEVRLESITKYLESLQQK